MDGLPSAPTPTRQLLSVVRVVLAYSLDALRRYVAVVIAHGAESDVDPAAGELAEALLAPIEAMRTKNAQRRASKPGAGDDEGEPDDGDDPMDPTEPTKPGDDDGND